MQQRLQNILVPYLVSVGITTAAVLLRLLLDPILDQTLVLVTLYGAIAFSAWYCGYRPALLVTLLGYAACNYLFMQPREMFHLNVSQIVGFVAYFTTCAIIIALGESTRIANKRFQQKEIQYLKSEVDLRASEMTTKDILESISDAFLGVDQDWRFNYVNHAAEVYLNRSAKDLLKKSLWAEYPEVVGTEIGLLYHKVISQQVADSIITFYDPHKKWYEISAYPAKNGLSIYFRDVTTVKLADAELRASEKRRQQALESAELGAWSLNPQSRVITTDERFNVIFTGEAAPKSYEEFLNYIQAEDRMRITDAVNAMIDQSRQRPYAEEYRVTHDDGSIHWVYAKGRLNFDDQSDNKQPISLDGTVSDITERKRIEQHLAQQSAELSEIDRRKNQFLATLAHELRNPLAPIRNSLSIMKLKSYDSTTVERASTVIERQVVQLVRLVDDLLDVSRITHGKLELKLERVEFRHIINMALETSKPLLDEAGLEFTKSIPFDPIYLRADLTRLSQVFLNLFNNAAKFTNPGGHVHLNVKRVPSMTSEIPQDIEITITDTGVGMTPESLPQVFEAFTQLPGTINRAQGGLGVGLMLVKCLIAMHGGTVKVHSDGLGFGTTFTIQLPTIDAASKIDIQTESSNSVGTNSGLRVLVVDDNTDAAISLSMLLEIMGNETQSVHDGLTALKAFADYKPDVVFLDIGLPDISGYEVAAKIRQQSLGKNIKLFALTGWGQVEDQQKSELAGFDKHIVKPIDPSVLSMLLNEVKI